MVQLRKVDLNNIWKIIKLSVNTDQLNFVATNTESILEAYTTTTSGGIALPFGIYNDDILIGFVMFGYDEYGDDEPAIASGNYCIWRFMIDKAFQGQGLGRKALQASLEYLHSEPCGQAEYCWLSYEPENTRAKALYNSMGFLENGEMSGGEIVAVCKLFD
jgi:diamine N-acetyltransferase